MRITLAALACLLSFAVADAADLSIVRVWPGYRTADSFQRISEALGGPENTSGQLVLRSRPEARDGFYFLTRYKNPGAPLTDVRVELHVILPSAAEPKRFDAFPAIALSTGSHLIRVGLTGADWTDAAAHPVAWQLRLLAPDGRELARERSFLWSLEK